MKKKPSLLKRIFKWIGILLLLIILFAVAAPFIFKDKIFAIVQDEANKNLNAKVAIGGFDLTLLSSFPDFTLSLDNVSVANINEFQGDTLISFKNLTATVNLMSIIKGEEYNIRTISIDRPRILAKVLSSGKANWDITKPSVDTTKAAPPSEPTKFKMKLKKLEIKEGNIVYDDRQGDMKTVLAGFNYTMGGDFTQDNFLLEIVSSIREFSFIYAGIPYMNNVNTGIKVNLDADMPNFKFTFKDNEFKLNALELGLDGYFAMPKEDMDMDMKLIARKTEFKNILSLVPGVYTKDFASVKTSGKLSLDAFVKGIYNDKVMPAFGTKLLIENGMFSYPSMPKSVNNILVDVKVDNKTGNPDHTVIDVNRFHVEMAGNPLDMRMHVSTPVSDANIDGEIKGKVDLASVREIVPMDKDDNLNGSITADIKLKGKMSTIEQEKYEEFNASGQLAVNNMNYKSKTSAYDMTINQMQMNFNPRFVELVSFNSKIGKSDIQADGKIENFLQYVFKDSLLKGTFSMKSSLMDLNEFMTEEETATSSAAAAASDTSSLSVIPVPANIDFIMTSSIGKLLYDTYDITNLSGKVVIRNKRVDMSQLKMNMMDGSLLMSGYYDTKDETKPRIDFKLNITDWDVTKTSKSFITVEKLAPIAKYATGKFSSDLTISGDLDKKMEPILSTLGGEGKLKTKNVMVAGFEPINKVADALKMDKYKKMAFNDINISFKFRDGKVHVDPFDMKLGNSLLTTSGWNSFDQSIDYKMKFDIPRAEFGSAANSALNSLVAQANAKGANFSVGDRVKIDVSVLGTVLKPIISHALAGTGGATVKDQIKDVAQQKITEVKEDVKAKARAEAEKMIKEAESQAQNIRNEGAKLASEAKKQGYDAADKLEAEAKNPLQKVAAKKGAEKLRKEADKKANDINSEADRKANALVEDVRKKAEEKLK